MEDLEKSVTKYLLVHQQELYELLSSLIQCNTENFMTHGNERSCAGLISGLYQKLSLDTTVYSPDDVAGIRQNPAYLPGRGLADRPNVTGVLHGRAPQKKVMLAAHTDTMPVGDPSKWSLEPLKGVIRDGRVYGRGACDDKCGIAAAYFALKAILACNISLRNDVLLTAYADEEYGGGDGSLAACLRYPCDTYVNLDGGKLSLWICAVGGQGLSLSVHSREPRDSAETVVQALNVAQRHILKFGARRKEELSRNHYFRGSEMERSALRILGFAAGRDGVDLDKGTVQFVFYTDRPRKAIQQELRELREQIAEELSPMGVACGEFVPTTRYFNYAAVPKDDLAVQIMAQAAEKLTGVPTVQSGACLSDLSIYLTCGSPSSFNIGVLRDFRLYGGAHQPDEYVECAELLRLSQIIAVFLLRWDGSFPKE